MTRCFWFAILALLTGLIVAGPAVAAEPVLNYEQMRNRMVDDEIIGGGVKNERVIAAFRKTMRHEFVQSSLRGQSYYDMSLPIGEKQTISAPFVVAFMTEQLDPQPDDKVLEIGTGSGFQAAILSPLVKQVYSIEIVEALGKKADATLKRLKYTNIALKIGDGYQGWPEFAPFDKIIVTCSPEKVPPKLVEQLKEGGRMIVPVGERYQQIIYLFKKEKGKLVSEALRPTLFVPMTGEAEGGRVVKPDPAHPKVYNGSFEEMAGKSGEPVGWYYQRQMKVVEDKSSPNGNQYVTFTNSDPGRASRMLQGLAVDGRKVHELEFSTYVKATNVLPGQSNKELPMLSVTFYDDNRQQVGPHEIVGPWHGSFEWKKEVEKIRVPISARECIIHIGLLGATGEVSFDNVDVRVTK